MSPSVCADSERRVSKQQRTSRRHRTGLWADSGLQLVEGAIFVIKGLRSECSPQVQGQLLRTLLLCIRFFLGMSTASMPSFKCNPLGFPACEHDL